MSLCINSVGMSLCITPFATLGFAIGMVCFGEGNGNPLQYSCLETPIDGEAWLGCKSEVWASLGASAICNAGDAGSIPGLGRSPGEGNATHSCILTWEIPQTVEPGSLQSMGSQLDTT